MPRALSDFHRWLTAVLLGATLAAASWPARGRAQESPDVPAPVSSDTGTAEVPWGEAVRVVRVEGTRRLEPDAILGAVSVRPGQPLTRAALAADVRTLWKQRLFDDVQVDVSPTPEGAVVTYVVTEKPLVAAVRTAGNSAIDDDELKKEIELKPFTVLDPDAARKSAKKIQEKYAEKGYLLADVTWRTEPASGDRRVDVVFEVRERHKVEVRRIAFEGNAAVSDDELRAVMQTREASILSFVTGAGTYREDMFERDVQLLQQLYYNKGYINVRITPPLASFSPDKRFLYLTLQIDEGEPFDFGVVEVSGDLLGNGVLVKPLLAMKSGERFSSAQLQQSLGAVQDFFRDRGHAFVQVEPRTGVSAEKKTVDIDLVVTPGPLVTVERIEVAGNVKTRDRVIRREMQLSEGDVYSGAGLRDSRSRVQALGFFESVDVQTRPGSAPDRLVLTVTVQEKSTGTFQVGLGFSNQEPILLNANVAQNNALGWGVNMSVMAQLSRLRRIFSLSYTDPYFLGTNWTGAFDLYNTAQFYGSLFERRATGGSVTGGYPILRDLRLFLTYTLQQVDVLPTSAQTVLLANRYRGGLTSSIKGSFNWDRRDNRLFPTSGYLWSGSAELAASWLGSENEFQRYNTVFRFYRPLWAGVVFKVNSTLGLIRSPSERPVPVSELFFEGGINSLRGYNFRTIAPTLEAGGQPGGPLIPVSVGGNKELLTNWELEFPVLQDAGLRGVLFFDAGNVYSEQQRILDPQAPGRFGLLMSAGVGARLFTPMGPLRFEWAVPLTRRPIDEASRFEFTIGSFF